jgi:hypothetical protein
MPGDGGYRRGLEAVRLIGDDPLSPRLGRVFSPGPDATLSADGAVLCAQVSDAYLAPSQPFVRAYRVHEPATKPEPIENDVYGRASVEVLLSGFGSLLCAAPTVEVTGWPCWKTTVP